MDLALRRRRALVGQQRNPDVRVCGPAEISRDEVSGLDDVDSQNGGLDIVLEREVDGSQVFLFDGFHRGLADELLGKMEKGLALGAENFREVQVLCISGTAHACLNMSACLSVHFMRKLGS